MVEKAKDPILWAILYSVSLDGGSVFLIDAGDFNFAMEIEWQRELFVLIILG